jgi:hypothetical protein
MAKQDTSKASGAVGIALPYLIGRPCRDHERRRSTEGNRARKGKRGGVQEKVKARCGVRW